MARKKNGAGVIAARASPSHEGQAMDQTNYVVQHVPLTTPRDYTRALIRAVAEAHGLTLRDVLGRSRTNRIVAARREAIQVVIRAKPHLSTPMVGRIFGIDHTSVLYALGGKRPEDPPQQIAAE